MLTEKKVSEPHLQWRKAQMGSGVAPFVCPETSFFAAPDCPMKLDGGIRDAVDWHRHIWTQGTPCSSVGKREETPLKVGSPLVGGIFAIVGPFGERACPC